MLRYVVLACSLLLTASVSSTNSVGNVAADGQELVFAMVVNRHGERAPDDEERSLSDRQEEILKLTHLEGPEGLTIRGKQRAYSLGEFLRSRYGSKGYGLISNVYGKDDIYVRSTDKDRTKMTIQVAMAAVYPPVAEQQWCPKDGSLGKVWQPVPYVAVPLTEDYLRFHGNCKRFLQLMDEVKHQALDNELKPYKDMIPELQKYTGQNFLENPLRFQMLFDLFRSLNGLNVRIPEWAVALQTRIKEAATEAYKLYFKTPEMRKIGGGVLLNQFIEAANSIVADKTVLRRLRLFSSHDFNLGAFMEASNVKSLDIPEYGSAYALELYKSKTGSYSVKSVYLPKAGDSELKTLKIIGCSDNQNSDYCDFKTFKTLVNDVLLPEHEYYSICNIRTEL